jgi:hypothetical protein
MLSFNFRPGDDATRRCITEVTQATSRPCSGQPQSRRRPLRRGYHRIGERTMRTIIAHLRAHLLPRVDGRFSRPPTSFVRGWLHRCLKVIAARKPGIRP